MKRLISTCLAGLAAGAFAAAAPAGGNVTNLFAEEAPRINQAVKKRADSSVLESGTKVGVKFGFNYAFGDQPFIMGAAMVDIPVAKKFGVEFDVGPVSLSPTNYSVKFGTASTNTNGVGQLDYLQITGTFRFFLSSFWIGPGLSYMKFLKGTFRFDNGTISPFQATYKVDNALDELYGIVSAGYMAEIRENVFVMPEIFGAIRISDFSTLRVLLNVNIGLAFRL